MLRLLITLSVGALAWGASAADAPRDAIDTRMAHLEAQVKALETAHDPTAEDEMTAKIRKAEELIKKVKEQSYTMPAGGGWG